MLIPIKKRLLIAIAPRVPYLLLFIKLIVYRNEINFKLSDINSKAIIVSVSFVLNILKETTSMLIKDNKQKSKKTNTRIAPRELFSLETVNNLNDI